MSGFDPDSALTAKYVLSLRLDRPIEGCELKPHAYLTVKGSTVEAGPNSTAAAAGVLRTKPVFLDSNVPHYFAFKWYRGSRKPLCSNPNCIRARTCDPNAWCKQALGGQSLLCAVCNKAGVPRHRILFCCVR